MKSLLLLLGLAAFAPTQDSTPEIDLDTALETLEKHRDDTPEAMLEVLRLDGTQEALDGLMGVYGKLETSYMQIRVISIVATYDDLTGAGSQPAEFIARAAANSLDSDVREAALVALSKCHKAGPAALQSLVNTPLPVRERERALELYIEMAPEGAFEYLRSIYLLPGLMEKPPQSSNERKKKRRKGDEEEEQAPKELRKTQTMRLMAMRAIAHQFTGEELFRFHQREPNIEIQPILLRALDEKRFKGIEERLLEFLQGPQYRERVRVVAAELVAKNQGIEALPLFMDVAKSKGTTSQTLYHTMARLMRAMPSEEVTDALKGRMSRAKGAELVFLMEAMPLPCDPKIVKKLAKGLRSRIPQERIAAVRFLERVGGEDSLKDLEKLLRTEKESHVTGAVMQALSALYQNSEEWMQRLDEQLSDKDEGVQHAARMEFLRLARPQDFERFVGWLAHPNWSVRQGALQALESLGEHRVLEPLIARMGEESGRLRFEFGETLFRLTGQDFGTRAPAWRDWYDQEGDEAKILTAAERREAERERVLRAQKERSRTPRFFDVPIRSASVIFVVDVSGSMEERLAGEYKNFPGETRIERAKAELSKAIQALPTGTRFNLVTFSGGVGMWSEDRLDEMGEPDREDALEWVSRLGALGGTNLYGGLLEAMSDPSVDTLVVLSDGEPSVGDLIDPGAIREDIAARNAERNIRIHTIALGGNLEILEWLAADSGGNSVQYE